MSDTLQNISTGLIDEPRFILRPVLRHSKEFLELCSSIEKHGQLQNILVRPKGERYECVFGNWRRTAHVDLKRPTMLCAVREMTDQQVLALQFDENAVRYETKPAEYANQLQRILDRTPGMTVVGLAALVSKHPNWIKQVLSIQKLDRETQLLIDRGGMPVMNGIMLAKIPAQWRAEQLANACQMTVREFKPLAAAIIKQYAECIRQGKLDARFSSTFQPIGHVRKPKDIQREIDDPAVGPLLIASEGAIAALDIWRLALSWSIHKDRQSIDELRRKAQNEGRLESEGNDLTD